MKTKAVLVSALVAAGLLALLARPRGDIAMTTSTPAASMGANPDHSRPAAPATRSSDAGPASERAEGNRARIRPAEAPVAASGDGDRLGIPTARLQEARQIAADMAARLADNEAALEDARYHNQSLNAGNPAKKLALRLGLDAGSAQNIEAVFSRALAAQIKERMESERIRLRKEAGLLAGNPDDYVSYLALQTMHAEGVRHSDEQQAFHDRFKAALAPDASTAASARVLPWYEDPKIVAAMNQQLAPAKQAEFAAYVEEQKERDQETRHMHARMRANQLSEQLGLGREDHSALLDYLKENPDAPNSEIRALLPSELQALLPAGS